MFVNGDAIGLVTELLTVGLVLLGLALMSHVVWISSLVRSRALYRFGTVARVALLALAAATPVISFYCASIFRHLRRHAIWRNSVGTRRIMLCTLSALATVMLELLAIEQLRQSAPGPHGSDRLSCLPGMILVLAVPSAVLGMACQVLVQSNRARAGLIVMTGSMAICLFLLA